VTLAARRVWFAAFILLVFILGLGSGVIVRPYLEQAATHWLPPPSPTAMVAMFTKRLDLTPTQQRQVEQILEARRQTFGTFSEDIRQRIDAERDRTLAEIEQVLTPEQRVRFQAMNQEMRDRPRPFPPFGAPPPPR
jgi:hypothetical protein